jgi:hypothetical protein
VRPLVGFDLKAVLCRCRLDWVLFSSFAAYPPGTSATVTC